MIDSNNASSGEGQLIPPSFTSNDKPVWGLPRSLLVEGDKKIILILDLLSKVGFDRLRRKNFDPPKDSSTDENSWTTQIQEIPDRYSRLVHVLGTPDFRFSRFWDAIEELVRVRIKNAAPRISRKAVISPDYAIINSIKADFIKLEFDREIMRASCEVWDEIEEKLRKASRNRILDLHLGVFMLWPEIRKELESNELLDPGRLSALSWVVFSLSSISKSRWFLYKSLELFPCMPELQEILDLPINSGRVSEVQVSVVPGSNSSADVDQESKHEPTMPEKSINSDQFQHASDDWERYLRDLGILLEAVIRDPSAENRLEFQRSSAIMSEVFQSSESSISRKREACEKFVASLMEKIEQCSSSGGLDFPPLELLAQIGEAWAHRISMAQSADELTALTIEIDDIQGRIQDIFKAATEIKNRLSAVQLKIKNNLVAIDSEKAIGRKRELQAGRKELKREEDSLEYELQQAEDQILHSISPSGDFSLAITSNYGIPLEEDSDLGNAPILDSGFSEIKPTLSDFSELRNDDMPLGSQTDALLEPSAAIEPPSALLEERKVELVADSDYSEEAGNICRPIWSALKSGHYGAAYQYSLALEKIEDSPLGPDSSLLAAIALANEMTVSDGSISERIHDYYTLLDAGYFNLGDAPASIKAAVNLLLVAATMKPIFIENIGSAGASLRYVATFSKIHQPVYQLAQKLVVFSELKARYKIDISLFKAARSNLSTEQQLESLEHEIISWVEREREATLVHSVASKVWNQWLKPDGEITKFLEPVLSGDLSKIDLVKERITSLSTVEEILRRVHSDKTVADRISTSTPDIKVFQQLVVRTKEAVRLAKQWVSIVELKDDKKGKIQGLVNGLFKDMSELHSQIQEEFSAPLEEDQWGIISSARAVLLASLDSTFSLFNSEETTADREMSADEVLGCELLLAPPVILDKDWRAVDGADIVISGIREAEIAGFDIKRAFNLRIEQNDLDGASRLIQIAGMRRGIREDMTAYSQIVARRKEENLEQLQATIDDIRLNNEIAYANGLTTETEHAATEAVLISHQISSQENLSFGKIFSELEKIREIAASRREKKIAEMRAGLVRLESAGASIATLEILKNSVESGDILTANEQFQRAERGEQLESAFVESRNAFSDFFPAQLAAIDEAMKGLQPNDLITQVRSKGRVGPLDFASDDASPEQVQFTIQMLEAWFSLKAHKAHQRDSLKTLLFGIGFTSQLPVPRNNQVAERTEWDVRISGIADKSICQIPHFGSNASGSYRITIIGQKYEEHIARIVGDGVISKPTLVFFLGRLNERKRREISRQVRIQQRSFILVDEIIMFKLASEHKSRLSLFFELTLPFSYSVPFDPTSSIVPIEMFFGRTEELRSIQDLSGRCFIYGGRQLGKTALLRKAEQSFHAPREGEGRFAKWIDLKGESIGTTSDVDEIWACLHREFSEIGLFHGKTIAQPDTSKSKIEAFVSELKALFKQKSGLRVLLLLDEADKFFELDANKDFVNTSRLKSIMESTGRRFKVVFAGLHNVLRTSKLSNNPLAHFGEPIQIGPLLEGSEWYEAQNLITRPFSAAGFNFESGNLVTRVLAQTNYYPSLIQLYCSHLLRHMITTIGSDLKMEGPQYLIQSRHIEAAYKGKNKRLLEEIRAKFQLTLQLDTRYEVIAYSIAYEVLNAGSLSNGSNYRDIRVLASGWWSEGFEDTDEHEFKVLLEEMVGLGVLRETAAGYFTLRNPNVILLLGGAEEIEALLSMDRKRPPELEHTTFRSRLSKNQPKYRSCLTAQDIERIKQPKNAVTIIAGSRASCIQDLEKSLQENIDSEFLSVYSERTERTEFLRVLHELQERPQGGTKIVVLSAEVGWSFGWIDDAIKRLSKFKAKDKHAHVLFVADPDTLWHCLGENFDISSKSVEVLTLRHWTEGFTSHWLEDCSQPHNSDAVAQVLDTTGLWPMLLAHLIQSDTSTFNERLVKLNHELSSPSYRAQMFEQFGIRSDIAKCLKTLAELGPHSEEKDIAELCEMELSEVLRIFAWAENLGYVTRSGKSSVTLNSWIAKNLQLPSVEPVL